MNNRRILIVDDNQALHEDFKKVLMGNQNPAQERLDSVAKDLFGDDDSPAEETAAYELDFAFQGEEALNKVVEAYNNNRPFALVFMDVRMPPGWDGISTVAKIWEVVPFTEIVICTAYSDYSLDDVITKLGKSERLLFLKKPFDSVEVQQMAIALTKKWHLDQENQRHTQDLENLVSVKTKELDIERSRAFNNAKLVALGEMAGGVAHEINNPLAIILSNISNQKELLLEEGPNKEMLIKIADKIEITTERISKIVRGLRAFSRSGDNDPFVSMSLSKVIEDGMSISGEKFKNNGVTLVFEKNKIPESTMIDCRSTQIIQVLLNLLNNAFDSIQKIPEKWIRVEFKDKGDRVDISITDCGLGISKEIQQKLFNPFFTTKDIGKGTGLGLSISKGIIEGHGGTLKYDHESPNTRFVIDLPKHQKDVAPPKVERK